MIFVAIVCAALLMGAAVLALIRAERGPSMLDRTVALDVFVTALVGGVVLESAMTGRTDTLPLLVVLSLVGFVGSVTIARFASAEPKGEGRVRSAEEIALEEAIREGREVDTSIVAPAARDFHEPKYPSGPRTGVDQDPQEKAGER
ncbi:multicomponent Na+:H+ antiporter subunit F [Sanguibacter gelidistatuariae]|uniref:Multicomponent Na+:H+ antiporter subunit F n=1 Tax=Sanguibacter gelidistatuariae TaxID=1814289 RepID=A0A1G6HBG6_9MICO|nr:monovalent cation/H+ antiporter complex subunit F [Sanguibacter gelidistatuariae]SDB91629.1 multicomponent Na+:H+ antiporter subunit F [Sanguibacter gelidistatuariae]